MNALADLLSSLSRASYLEIQQIELVIQAADTYMGGDAEAHGSASPPPTDAATSLVLRLRDLRVALSDAGSSLIRTIPRAVHAVSDAAAGPHIVIPIADHLVVSCKGVSLVMRQAAARRQVDEEELVLAQILPVLDSIDAPTNWLGTRRGAPSLSPEAALDSLGSFDPNAPMQRSLLESLHLDALPASSAALPHAHSGIAGGLNTASAQRYAISASIGIPSAPGAQLASSAHPTVGHPRSSTQDAPADAPPSTVHCVHCAGALVHQPSMRPATACGDLQAMALGSAYDHVPVHVHIGDVQCYITAEAAQATLMVVDAYTRAAAEVELSLAAVHTGSSPVVAAEVREADALTTLPEAVVMSNEGSPPAGVVTAAPMTNSAHAMSSSISVRGGMATLDRWFSTFAGFVGGGADLTQHSVPADTILSATPDTPVVSMGGRVQEAGVGVLGAVRGVWNNWWTPPTSRQPSPSLRASVRRHGDDDAAMSGSILAGSMFQTALGPAMGQTLRPLARGVSDSAGSAEDVNMFLSALGIESIDAPHPTQARADTNTASESSLHGFASASSSTDLFAADETEVEEDTRPPTPNDRVPTLLSIAVHKVSATLCDQPYIAHARRPPDGRRLHHRVGSEARFIINNAACVAWIRATVATSVNVGIVSCGVVTRIPLPSAQSSDAASVRGGPWQQLLSVGSVHCRAHIPATVGDAPIHNMLWLPPPATCSLDVVIAHVHVDGDI
ncbi:MAG: hypothetical protein EOO41_01875, partial [Methanobacteriota archaeon]